MFKLMLDPGHGGKDPGAVAYGLREKDLVLTIGKGIRDVLLAEYEGVEVRMTRETDTFLELDHRAALANDWGANYFLSLHVNAGGGSGFESYVHQSRSPASVAAQNVIHSEIMKRLPDIRDRGKKSANFAVLKLTKMPAILTETLFIDNALEASRLKSSVFLEQVAVAHVVGLEKVFGLKKKSKDKDALKTAVQKLQRAGIISSPDYWLQTARAGQQAKGENVQSLIIKMADKLG